ncbi:MAG: serine protease [Deltaproteobacteria bacterium]
MITNNVYHRVFQIKVGKSTGTCFTIDIEQKQYVVTARHLIQEWEPGQRMHIFHDKEWKEIEMTLVGRCGGEIDIAVLAPLFQLSPPLSLPATSGGIVWGQDVYFLGFPYGWYGDIGELNRNFPMPFVKKAILSCTYMKSDGVQHFFLDGHNNLGFSGGPVVFKELNNNEFKVASVISGYRYTHEPILAGEQEVALAYRYNTGIIVSYGIKHAVEVISDNPIGLPIRA